jgi:hypothetical protein
MLKYELIMIVNKITKAKAHLHAASVPRPWYDSTTVTSSTRRRINQA